MEFILDLIYLLAALIMTPKVIYRAVKQGRYRNGWGERFGNITRRHPDKPCIWIHAVSVGEVNAASKIIQKLNETLPGSEIIISTTTDTGHARATAIYGETYKVFFYPLDFSLVVRRAFRKLKPDICLLMELEVWPNFATIAKRKNIPLVVVNGRLSDKSFPRYQKIKRATQWMFKKVSLILAQTDEYADRFKALGCPADKVIITSSLKYDTAQFVDKVEGTDDLAQQLNVGDERIWVAGSTGPEEEQLTLDIFARLRQHHPDLRLAIVPRKPERFDEVAGLIDQTDFSSVRFSTIKPTGEEVQGKPDIILGDTMGDLRKFYSLATVIFVGRSLVPMGGSDMIEPAALGKCTIFGVHTFNFKQTVDILKKGEGAIEVSSPDQLCETIDKCLTDADYAYTIAAKGRELIKAQQGATERSVAAIANLLRK